MGGIDALFLSLTPRPSPLKVSKTFSPPFHHRRERKSNWIDLERGSFESRFPSCANIASNLV